VTEYLCTFCFHGVFLTVTMSSQGTKHNETDPIEAACEAFAAAIGATYLYRTEVL
jgi:hypothetical protein